MPKSPPPKSPPRREPRLEIGPGDRPVLSGGDGPPPPEGRPAPRKRPRPTRAKRSWLGRLAMWTITAAIWAGIGIAGLVAYYAIDLPDIDQVTATTRRPSVVFLSAEGETFAAYGDLYGKPLTLGEIPQHAVQAVLATEDRRFFSHFGLDPRGLARAALANLRAGRVVQGGSTITQQLAKNLFLKPDRTLKRKVQELLMALWLEQRFTKEQILTLYLNRVYLGSGTFGIDAAARRYFEVPARRLSLYQAAMIAGLLKAPSRYSPLNDPEAAHRRTGEVLSNMVEAGFLERKAADLALLDGAAQLVQRPVPGGRHFADWVLAQLDGLKELEGRDVVVHTTLDMHLQRKVEANLKATLDGPGAKAAASQGAVVVMAPDGAVRAMAGGKDYDESQFNRAAQGLRQPGSAFKPLVYLAAMESGLSPEDVFDDAPIRIGDWRPENYSGKYEGPVTLRHALAQSTNSVAVRLVEQVGAGRVVSLAKRLGISSNLRADGSIALGTSEVSLLELTTAYAALANGGEGVAAFGVVRVTDPEGNELYRRAGGGFGRVVSPGALASMHDMMQAVLSEGTGKSARLDRPAAGKTGTTQDYRDAWFMGFTADYVAGVWLGNDDYRVAMKKVTGGGLPAQLWRKVMADAHAGLPPRPLILPEPEGWSAGPLEDTIAPVAEGAGQAVRRLGDAIDDLIRGLFGN